MIPFDKADFIDSRVIIPMTRFGKRDRSDMNRFNTAICRGFDVYA